MQRRRRTGWTTLIRTAGPVVSTRWRGPLRLGLIVAGLAVSVPAAAQSTATATAAPAPPAAAAPWRPTRPIQLIVPAGTGGGADRMARLVQSVIIEHRLLDQPVVITNRAAEGGTQGMMEMRGHGGDPHKLIITLSNLFTAPLSRGIPFGWRDLTPVAMLALDEFILWVPEDAPYRDARDFISTVRAGADGQFRMAGTGSKQEDQLVTTALEAITQRKMTYLPFSGGGAVAAQLAAKQVDATVNNPIEGLSNWQQRKVRPLCVFDGSRMPYTARVTPDQAWQDIPTCREAGIDVEYLMLRGIFMADAVSPEQVRFYIDLFARVRATPQWQDFMVNGAFKQTFMHGAEFVEWLEAAERTHRRLMRDAGFIAN